MSIYLSPTLRRVNGWILGFYCPGCKRRHHIHDAPAPGNPASPVWQWNGSVDRPTFTPSLLIRGAEFTPAGLAAYEAWCEAGFQQPAPEFERMDTVCHSFITDGKIQFLGDCTHHLAGQAVDIPVWPY